MNCPKIGERFPLPKLSRYGKIADKRIKGISQKYPSVFVDYYVVMPNHIHILMSVQKENGTGNPSPTVDTVMGWLKYNITKEINQARKTVGEKVFQRSFYDHVIRSRADYEQIANYIYENPTCREFDELYLI